MAMINTIHQIFGERVLPLLIVIMAVWLTVNWKPDNPQPNFVARLFPLLVMWQFALGLLYWIYGMVALGLTSTYLSFPFILHPILGALAVIVAARAVKPNPEKSILSRMLQPLGRWAPMVALLLLFFIVAGSILTGAAV